MTATAAAVIIFAFIPVVTAAAVVETAVAEEPAATRDILANSFASIAGAASTAFCVKRFASAAAAIIRPRFCSFWRSWVMPASILRETVACEISCSSAISVCDLLWR